MPMGQWIYYLYGHPAVTTSRFRMHINPRAYQDLLDIQAGKFLMGGSRARVPTNVTVQYINQVIQKSAALQDATQPDQLSVIGRNISQLFAGGAQTLQAV